MTALVGILLGTALTGCSADRILGSGSLPPDVADPGQTQTAAGAVAMYRSAVGLFAKAFGGSQAAFRYPSDVVVTTGLFTDELGASVSAPGISASGYYTDARLLPEYTDPTLDPTTSSATAGSPSTTYGLVQKARGQISEALGALAAYAPDAPPALRGRLHALEGYDEIFLADLYCSGVPLSTLDFNGDFTYASGSSTSDVYRRAIAQFDTAVALSSDSAELMDLARVGTARALLDLGAYDSARAAAAAVPDGFNYQIQYRTLSGAGVDGGYNFATLFSYASAFPGGSLTMTDREGSNGLPYLSSKDPRTPGIVMLKNQYGESLYRPAAYATDGSSPITLASGVEARLIEAEVDLHDGDAAWLTTLNALRTDGTYDTYPDPNDSTKTDTIWHAGTGGVAGLAPLQDPGTPDARVDLVFQERGYWLFLTGERQGDLRRLVRNYGRDPDAVYPQGTYAGLSGHYGSDVNAPIPATERQDNPRFHGCINRGA